MNELPGRPGYLSVPTSSDSPDSGEKSSQFGTLRDIMTSRQSCRGFRSEPVPHRLIESIVSIAALSPSWCNTQPWNIVITEGAATDRFRDALTAHVASNKSNKPAPDFDFPIGYSGVYLERRRECGLALYESVGVERGDRRASAAQAFKNFELFGAPHAAILTTEAELGTYGAVDCGIYLSNFLLAAQSVGVAAIPQAALASYSPFIRDHFGLADTRLVVAGVSFGWPDVTHRANGFRTTRAPLNETVSWV
jgi:nitroreductase